MNHNVAMQHLPLRAWAGATSYPRDIRLWNYFAFAAEVIAPLGADTIFEIRSHPPSVGDPCVPGAPTPVPEVPLCDPSIAGEPSRVTIPANTPVGTVCTFTIPCRPDRFVSIAGVSGETADVAIQMVLSGPQI